MKTVKIKASKCAVCDRAIVPPRETCPYCGPAAGKMTFMNLDNKGTILSYTISHMPPTGFDSPLTLALVEIEHNAVILCVCNSNNSLEPTIDSHVAINQDDDGRFLFASI